MPGAPAAAPRAANRLRLFLPFAAGYYLSYLLRNANAVIAPALTRELGLDAADLGLLTAGYFFAFGAFQVPLGILLDRYGPRRVESVLLLVAAAGALTFALGRSVAVLAVGRALIGLGVSACLMAALKNFSQWYPLERQSALTGAVMTAGGLGAVTASVPLATLLPVLGWRGVFASLAAVLIAASAGIFIGVPQRHEPLAPTDLAAQWRDVTRIFGDRRFWRFAPLMACFSGGSMALVGLWIVPWFIAAEKLTRAAAARHLLAMALASLASYFAIATFATPIIRAGVKPHALIAASLAVAWLCLAAAVAGVRPALPLWVGFSFCVTATTLGYTALAGDFSPGLFGRVSTTLNLLAFFGAFSLQWGLGVLVDAFRAAGWSAAEAFRAAFACLALLQLLAWSWYMLEGRHRAGGPAH